MSITSFVSHVFKSQYAVTLPRLDHDFSGQYIIVTGANTGLGREAARHFVRLGAAKVIIACRTLSKGEAAKQDIETSTGRKDGVVEVWELDLASYASVRAFAQRAEKELPRLDVVLENAGVSSMAWSMSEGNESTITTNVISTFLLGLLLLPKLKATQAAQAVPDGLPPRLVIVTSDTHEAVNLTERHSESIFGHLNDKSKMTRTTMGWRYPKSKLLEILVVRALVDSLSSSSSNNNSSDAKHTKSSPYPVVINCVNPGFCRSELMRSVEWARSTMYFLLNARTTAVGGGLLATAATMSHESDGKYISNGVMQEPSAWVRSEDGRKTGERVWAELREKLEGIEPGIMSKL